jgi:hypothetical protein
MRLLSRAAWAANPGNMEANKKTIAATDTDQTMTDLIRVRNSCK